MKYGFIKVAAASPNVHVGDTFYNLNEAKKCIDEANAQGANLLVLPELYLSSYSCGDLFYSDTLLRAAIVALAQLKEYTAGKSPVVTVGVPVRLMGKLYNCAAVVYNGHILGIVPKVTLPNYGEFYERRQFTSGADYRGEDKIDIAGESVPFGRGLLFCCREIESFVLGVEICEDLWSPIPQSTGLCLSGATVIANLSASNELVGKEDCRRQMVATQSSRLVCGYVYASSGRGESTQDLSFGGHCIVCENGMPVDEKLPFAEKNMLFTELDLHRIISARHMSTCFDESLAPQCQRIFFSQEIKTTALTRNIPRNPFAPDNDGALYARTEAILRIQTDGLMHRVEHIHCPKLVIGISGGLDSTLALLVAVRTMDALKRSRSDIIAVTMPCFGTTKRTRSNAELLCECMGVSFKEVDISASVRQHFKDIGHDECVTDVTYENAQARERTQVLMDIANECGGIVVGTGDLSELALGWATYNGDHMSMYGVNASVPKTLVRHIVRCEMHRLDSKTASVLEDILSTPVSPELLPAKDGEILQKTEDLVGPYELHDFFLYHMLRTGSSPARIYHLAEYAFAGEYDNDTILKWLRTFIRRFFAQQFKRSCLPDGPKVGTVSLSPRGDWRMPSDATAKLWLDEVDTL